LQPSWVSPNGQSPAYDPFVALKYHLTSAAVLDGNSPGRVFVYDPAWSRTFPLVFPDGDAGEAKKEALLAVYDRFAEETRSWERV